MTPLLGCFGAVVGACLGSYATTAALRRARTEQSTRGRSRCDACRAELSFGETTPLLAFLALRGRCRRCDARIDRVHLVGEAAAAIMVGTAFCFTSPPVAMALSVLGLALLASSITDALTQRLPDELTLFVALIGAGLAWRAGPSSLLSGCIAAAIAWVLLVLLRSLVRTPTGDPALGLGDVKLIAAVALWLGALTPWAVAIASMLGLAVSRTRPPIDGRIAFGPMIGFGAWTIGFIMEAAGWRGQI